MLLQIYLAAEKNAEETTNGGVCTILSAINPKTQYIMKQTEYMNRYWGKQTIKGLDAIIHLLLKMDRGRPLVVELMPNPILEADHIPKLLERSPGTEGNMFNLFPANVHVVKAESACIGKLETRTQTVARKLAFHAHSFSDHFLSICPKCFTDYDESLGRMFGWECQTCGVKLVDI